MTTCPRRLVYRRLRTPHEDRSVLADPPLSEIGRMVDRNVRNRAEQDYDFQGRSLAELSRQGRDELLAEARRWTSAYRDLGPEIASAGSPGPIFLAGHQPQVFHPGVWVKNFALDRLARRHAATSVNLVIDSDTIKSTALRVPGGSVSEPTVATIPYDVPEPRLPYEERPIVDRRMFGEFGHRVREQIAPLVADPLVETYWPLVTERMGHGNNLGTCLAQARGRLEADWGVQTLEVPQSRVCRSESFCWLAAHLLAHAPRVLEIHNQAVREYRQVHRIRSTAHPVPELTVDGPWFESPLWMWTADDPRRRAVFVEPHRDRLVLGDRHGWQIDLPLTPDAHADKAVERLMELDGQGVRIRSRALITTLWARLVLGDLFIHGIGGAKYDQVTDLLIERFFGLRPPGFMVLSATLHLPIPRQQPGVDPHGSFERQLRELVHHPERHLDRSDGELPRLPADVAAQIAAKNRWIATPQTPENAAERHRVIRRINESLQPYVALQREQLLRRQAEASHAARVEKVLAWREYAFALYPAETLRAFLAESLD